VTIQLYFGPWDPNNDPNFSWISQHGSAYQNPAINPVPAPHGCIDINVAVRNHGDPNANPVKITLYAVDCSLDQSQPTVIAAALKGIVAGGTPLAPSPWGAQTVPAYSQLGSTQWNIPNPGHVTWRKPASGKYVILATLEYTGGPMNVPTITDDYSQDPCVGVWIQF
jgi:hypothetical protein